jgi:histone-arginine methyltransferase CARM1
MLEFDIPLDFVVSRTSIIHGLASWFDLDFEPAPAVRAEPDSEADIVEQAAWDFPVSAPAWPWMTAEPPLNPGPTPEPPRKGLKVTLSTGPSATRTHWQ